MEMGIGRKREDRATYPLSPRRTILIIFGLGMVTADG